MNRSQAVITFLDAVETPVLGEQYFTNSKSEIMNIEISGTSTDFQIIFEGKVKEHWRPVMAVNLEDLSYSTSASNFTGIWQLSLIGLNFVRISVVSIVNGNVTVVGRVVG